MNEYMNDKDIGELKVLCVMNTVMENIPFF